jgi:hypothetical protein
MVSTLLFVYFVFVPLLFVLYSAMVIAGGWEKLSVLVMGYVGEWWYPVAILLWGLIYSF